MTTKLYDNKLIAQAMKARRMTLISLAAAAGIKTVDTVRAVLAGENVRMSTLQQVCGALGLTIRITK